MNYQIVIYSSDGFYGKCCLLRKSRPQCYLSCKQSPISNAIRQNFELFVMGSRFCYHSE